MQEKKLFRLIGGTLIFRVEREYKSGCAIPAVVGYTLDKKRMAIAAESDIVWLNEVA